MYRKVDIRGQGKFAISIQKRFESGNMAYIKWNLMATREKHMRGNNPCSNSTVQDHQKACNHFLR